MTEITDAEVAEIQWASSEEGKAALRAAWDKTKRLGLGTRAVDMADIGAIVYAAYLEIARSIAGPDPLDDRLLAMAGILREAGNEDAADEIEVHAAFVREALRGSDDGSIAENLVTVADYAREMVTIVRRYPSAADGAERNGEQP